MSTEPEIPAFAPEPTTTGFSPAPPAPSITTFEDPAAEAEREEAFSADFEWNGCVFPPPSLERYNVFVTQRVAMAAPPLGDALRDGAGFFPDAQRLIWISSQPWQTVQALRRDPEAMQTAIEEWAAKNAPICKTAEVIDLGLKIFNASQENQHEARPSNRVSRSSSGN